MPPAHPALVHPIVVVAIRIRVAQLIQEQRMLMMIELEVIKVLNLLIYHSLAGPQLEVRNSLPIVIPTIRRNTMAWNSNLALNREIWLKLYR